VSSQPSEQLTSILRRGQARFRLPGVSAAVYHGGEVVWADAIGIAEDGGPDATPDTQYRIGSITKTFTAAAVMLLREEGRLELDDPLGRHLPGARFGELPLRRLLAHSSGLQREPPGEVWETLEFPKGEELVARTTWHSAEPAARGYYVDPYARTLRQEPTLQGDGVEAVGSLWSTPSDLCRWAGYLAGQEAMHQVQIMDDPETWTLGHGLGLQLARRGERVFFGHGGAMPGFLAMLLGRRQEGVGAALVTNASTPAAAVEEITAELAEQALELYPADEELWRAEAAPPPEIEELLGVWWAEGTPFTFWWEAGALHARPSESDKPRAVSVFAAEGAGRFRVAEGPERGELLRAVRGADGSIAKLYWATYPVTRTPETFS
jgi:CubicO group peptidase (beta-lactamase class C family)